MASAVFSCGLSAHDVGGKQRLAHGQPLSQGAAVAFEGRYAGTARDKGGRRGLASEVFSCSMPADSLRIEWYAPRLSLRPKESNPIQLVPSPADHAAGYPDRFSYREAL